MHMQAVVDSCLGELRLFAVTTGLFSLSSTPCLAYRSPFQHSSVRHHPLDLGPSHALRAIAGALVGWLYGMQPLCGGCLGTGVSASGYCLMHATLHAATEPLSARCLEQVWSA
jgi:hypothetical protein